MAKTKDSDLDAAVEAGIATGNQPADSDHDRVVMLSRRADGKPDQTDPELIGDKEFAEAAAAEQLTQQKVSAADVAIRGAATDESGGGSSEPDAAVAPIKAAHEAAKSAAEAQAKAEVASLHKGLGA